MIESTCHFQSLGCRRPGNEVDDGLIVAKRLPSPVRGDERKETMLHLVPFAGSRGEMTDRDRQTDGIRKFLQLVLP